MRRRLAFFLGLLACPGWAAAHVPVERPNVRRATVAQLTVPVERHVLDNGLVLILSPDDDATTVVVDHVLRAGAVYEPPGRHGMAHLTEHVMYRGTTPDTEYDAILRRRGAIDVGAFTSRESMRFVVVMPPEELPVALWVAADRLAELPQRLGRVDLAQHKRIVLAERNERSVDREYGLVDELIDHELFPDPHPLHAGVGGTPESIGAVTLADVETFVRQLLVPANGVLVITGRFSPKSTVRLVREYFATIPGGQAAAPPTLPRPTRGGGMSATEPLSREPRVTLAWPISGQTKETYEVLDQGALLLTLSTDGTFGTRVRADLDRYAGEALFRVDVTLPYDKPRESAIGEADAFLRYLTLTDVDRDLIDITNLHQDRAALFGLDSMRTRATLLAELELNGLDPVRGGKSLERHWLVTAPLIQETARRVLRGGRLVVHAQPDRPRQPKAAKE